MQFPGLFARKRISMACTSTIWKRTISLPSLPPSIPTTSIVRKDVHSGAGNAGRGGISLTRSSLRARPSHPVIPRCLLGFSWLRIVRAQCFPTSTKLSQNSLSTAKVSFSLLREIANEKWRLHTCIAMRISSLGRASAGVVCSALFPRSRNSLL